MAALLTGDHNEDGKRLELVQVLFRHGERTPNKDEYLMIPYIPPSVYEPYKWGELTNNGRMQAYELGSVLRKRYANYLDDVYKSEDLYAHSSDSERAIATMQLVLAGLYPPTESFQWNPALNWQPIPYFYIPGRFDVLLKPVLGKRYDEIRKRETDGMMNDKMDKEYQDIIRLIEKEFGSKFTPEQRLHALGNVYNVLHGNERMGIPLPKWCTSDIMSRLRYYFAFGINSYSYTPQMRRMNGGPLIKKFVDNMNIDETVRNPRKMYLYSAHDMTLGAVARALKIEDFDYPDYSSAIIVEKFRDVDSNRLYVRLVGRLGAGEEFETLKFGNCSGFCPMEEFLTIAKEVIPSDEEMHHMEKEFEGSLTNDIFLNDPYVNKQKNASPF